MANRDRNRVHAPTPLAPLAVLAALAVLVLPAATPALAGSATTGTSTGTGTRTGTGTGTGTARVGAHALLKSRELWATIDVCSPKDQPNTIGIRGSMPGDGRAADRMYMSFRLQYMSPAGRWVDLASGATPGYVNVGGAGAAREGGRSFQLVPVAGKPASELRGVVDFQWRRGRTVLVHASRASSAGHRSVAGADPAGFSAASCLIG